MKRTALARYTPLRSTSTLRRTALKSNPETLDRNGGLARRSRKRAVQERRYSVQRRDYLAAHPWCVATLPGCTGLATEVHHRQGRVGELLNDVDHFLAACHGCHAHITEHPAQAYLLGLSERRNGVAS